MSSSGGPSPSEGDLGTALAVLRLVRGWNQEELSRLCGIRSGTISDYERGKMVPGLKTLQRLLAALGYPLSAVGQTQTFIVSSPAFRGSTSKLLPGVASSEPESGEP